MDLDAFLNDYEPQRVAVQVCSKAGLVARHAELDAELTAAQQAARDDLNNHQVSALVRDIQELEQEIAASQATFVFQGLPYEEWQTLKRKHPPTQAQRREQGLDINIDTFALPAIAECAVDPTMTTDQATRLAKTLPNGEVEKMFRAALAANGETPVPKSVLAALIERVAQNGKSSITAALEESLAASSSDDDD